MWQSMALNSQFSCPTSQVLRLNLLLHCRKIIWLHYLAWEYQFPPASCMRRLSLSCYAFLGLLIKYHLGNIQGLCLGSFQRDFTSIPFSEKSVGVWLPKMLLCSLGLSFALMVLIINFQGHYFHTGETSNFPFVFLKSLLFMTYKKSEWRTLLLH